MKHLLCGASVGVLMLVATSSAQAQDVALDGIVITAPSPLFATAPAESLSLPGQLIVVDDAFAPVTVVTDRDILSDGGANVADSLFTKPGISGTTFAPGANRPVIRGLDTYRVRVQENGIGL
ncbi:MAG: TonB-dependent receptor plug domain-containing protein [Pseudomonadota bacterium]